MEEEKKEKAIEQALASLRIDEISVSQDFLTKYRNKNGLASKVVPQLVLKRSTNNGKF